MENTIRWVGIDAHKDSLSLAVLEGRYDGYTIFLSGSLLSKERTRVNRERSMPQITVMQARTTVRSPRIAG